MEPLKTDEPLATKGRKERDMDDHMLLGCSGFVVISFGAYFLSIWPFLYWLGVHELAVLGIALVCGFPAAFLVGALACWRMGLAGAAGFVGGILAAAIFLYLRFEQVFVEAAAQRTPMPDYPGWVQWFLPSLIVAFSLLITVAILVLFSAETRSKSAAK